MNTFLIGAIGATLFWSLLILLWAVWDSAVDAKARDIAIKRTTEEIEAGKREQLKKSADGKRRVSSESSEESI